MEKIKLSLEDTLFAKEHGAKWYYVNNECFYKVDNDVVMTAHYDGAFIESSYNTAEIEMDDSFYEIDFSILDEHSKYKQLALQMAESVYNLSQTLDSLTPEEGIELQKALEAALIVLKEGV